MVFANFTSILPPAYMTANIIDDIQAISLYDVWKISCISLKNTVMALGNAQENPMEIKAPKTTTHPQPPSGGGYCGAAAGGIFGLCLFSNQAEKEEKKQGFKQFSFFSVSSCSIQSSSAGIIKKPQSRDQFPAFMGPQNTSTCFQKQNLFCKKNSWQEYLRYPIQYVATVTNH